MDLFKHNLVMTFKSLLKPYQFRNRRVLPSLLMVLGGVVVVPVFLIGLVFFFIYWGFNILYTLFSGTMKRFLVKTKSVLLLLPMFIPYLFFLFGNLAFYLLTKICSRSLLTIIRVLDVDRSMQPEDLIFFISGDPIGFSSFRSR